jgi:uncharacterized protein YjbJ (UPF0337 family)
MTQYDPDTDSGSTTEQVKEQVGEKAQVAQERARGAAEQARGRFRDQVDQRSTQAGERLSGTATDVRSMAEELRRQGKDTPARLVEQAAGRADRAADYLKGASGDRLLRDVEDLARANPWAVAAGGLALGFAASRFLKASSRRRYQQAQAGYPTGDDSVDRTPEHDTSPYALAAAEPVVSEEGPLLGGYEQAAPTATARVPVEPEQRAPRAE